MKIKKYKVDDKILISDEADEIKISAKVIRSEYDHEKNDWIHHVIDENESYGSFYQKDIVKNLCDFDDWHPDF